MQVASTMNQSDIRGLSIRTEPTLIFSVLSLAFYDREFSSIDAYRIGCSQITLYRACICLCHPYSFGGGLIEEKYFKPPYLSLSINILSYQALQS